MRDENDKQFNELVADHLRLLRRRAANILGNEADAKDVVQHALKEAWVRLIHCQGAEAWRAFMVTAVVNGSISQLRHRDAEARKCGNVAWVLLSELDSEAPRDQDELWRYIEPEDVLEALAFIKPKLRAVYELRAQGLSYAEISSRLKLPSGTVANHLSRARDELFERLLPLATLRRDGPKPSS
ncbi:RNA polymerase sigma factor [Pyxidicoccus sp. MSG2]|uniref:RNA polymerase sigma factor n=1 Tax=Pyxidicoccus sp. MSG2 TaxID=2996790 RepID=UPI00226D6702|nr:RNA polymerase sigma factor [Pyxidicoccus sp. MSG2]MCY1022721.1 RNA polymerase sigma factor [Pyxidicoccus sp. MSG2]